MEENGTYAEIRGLMRMFVEKVMNSALAVFQIWYEQKKTYCG